MSSVEISSGLEENSDNEQLKRKHSTDSLKSDHASPKHKDNASPKHKDNASPKHKDDSFPKHKDDASPKHKDNGSPIQKDEDTDCKMSVDALPEIQLDAAVEQSPSKNVATDNDKTIETHPKSINNVETGESHSKRKRKHSESTDSHLKLKHDDTDENSEHKHGKTDTGKAKVVVLSNETDDLSSKGIGVVVASHYNKLEEKGLSERNLSRIVFMRNFNNWLKSFLLSKYLELIRENSADDHRIIALDLGCGKGGDLLKWQKGKIRHLICADIASTSISQCQERYENFKQRERGKTFTAEFIVADCTKVRLKPHLEHSETKIDLVSCQFAFHYSFESLAQAETMIQNASESLRKGGYFIATMPDANKIMSCLEASGTNGFGNEVFRIEFPENRGENPPLFGDTYNFFLEGVVNCPEFLVHFPTLIRICKKYGLELIYRKSFDELYKEGLADRDSKGLLFKMRALEMYPSQHGFQLSSQNEEEEYSHASGYLKEQNVKSIKTLSKSEWETICLYMACAFKKVT